MICYDLSSDDSDSLPLSLSLYIYIYLYLQIISVYLLFYWVVFAFEIRGSEGEVVAVVFTFHNFARGSCPVKRVSSEIDIFFLKSVG